MMEMRIGERVVVDAAVTGDGVHHHGVIEDIYDFLRTSIVDVRFDEPTSRGERGATISNLGMLRKEERT